jgi:hypothetical protein
VRRRQLLWIGVTLSGMSQAAYGHQIELGYGTLKAACRVERSARRCVLSVFCVSGSFESHVDQRVKITAVIIPNRAVEGSERKRSADRLRPSDWSQVRVVLCRNQPTYCR